MKFCSVVTQLWLILCILNQFKGYNSCTTETSDETWRVSARYGDIYLYFHEILFSSYLVMARDGRMERWTAGHVENNIIPPSAGG